MEKVERCWKRKTWEEEWGDRKTKGPAEKTREEIRQLEGRRRKEKTRKREEAMEEFREEKRTRQLEDERRN